jgi:hypothetical protein
MKENQFEQKQSKKLKKLKIPPITILKKIPQSLQNIISSH